MLHLIGKKPARKSEELVDLLLACHGRLRSFLAIAVAIGERADASDEDLLEATARVRRYFSDALPLHVEDEEDSVLPRLYGRSAALDRMCVDHDAHLPPLRRLLALCDGNDRLELARAAIDVRALLEPHLREEERVVFEAIRTLLSAEERNAIVSELRARRRRT